VRFVPAVKAFGLCLLLGGSAVGYVVQKNQIYHLARQKGEKEVLLDRLRWENRLRLSQLADLQSSTKLAERVRAHRLDLVMPHASQVIWLRETLEESAVAPLVVAK
jgi:hypothetical protein